MLTFQDFEAATDQKDFILKAISEHEGSPDVKLAKDADEYDRQKNITILNYLKVIYTMMGNPIVDFTASNAKITSNFFHRMNTQRNTYLLGNGVTFQNEETKERLGKDFDDVIFDITYNALIHKVCYGFWNYDKLHIFKYTEFKPLLDEETSALRAGIRYWKLDSDKPTYVVLYEEDGYTKYRISTKEDQSEQLEEIQPKKAYIQQVSYSEAEGETIVGEYNYPSLPIIPLWGNKRHQSTLVGTREAIDSYDLVRSGFANDLNDIAQIYWLIENAAGMDDDDMARFRDRLKIQHIAAVDVNDDSKVTPYTQEIPYQARKTFLDDLKAQIYEDFGALDVHQVQAGSTNDHLEAAYQPLDEEADDLEYEVTQFIDQLLKLVGIDDYPTYKRNRISNQPEQTAMVLSASEYLDDETVLSKLPFITVDEIAEILNRKQVEAENRLTVPRDEEDEEKETPPEEAEEDEDQR